MNDTKTGRWHLPFRKGGSHDVERAVVRTDDEWRAQLTDAQFRVLRRSGTERPFTNEAVVAGPDGMYRCGACDAALFAADTKFESGSGWPSFFESTDEVELHRDFSMGMPRTEVRCRRCGSHLGHVFNDGPRPTGKRYCINGCALATPSDR